MKAILMLNEMPRHCLECPLSYGADIEYCYITGKEKEIFADNETELKRNADCPLIEINDNIAKLIEVAR